MIPHITDYELKEVFNTIDFSQMVTADDLLYMVARAALALADRKLEEQAALQAGRPVPPLPEGDRVLFVPDVCALVGLSHWSIYTKAKEGSFPKPFKIGGRNAFHEREVREWLRQNPQNRRNYGLHQ